LALAVAKFRDFVSAFEVLMFDLSADATGWLVTFIILASVLGILAVLRWFWR
jgi:hypothetical protein